jgi:hypothetical protein
MNGSQRKKIEAVHDVTVLFTYKLEGGCTRMRSISLSREVKNRRKSNLEHFPHTNERSFYPLKNIVLLAKFTVESFQKHCSSSQTCNWKLSET